MRLRPTTVCSLVFKLDKFFGETVDLGIFFIPTPFLLVEALMDRIKEINGTSSFYSSTLAEDLEMLEVGFLISSEERELDTLSHR